ncbi:hypothetical protein [Pyxidicoccus caerfyrddinensis]|uniref:hypothetical protein n=1 Tax=Pyxidicoccus caerfyrddinensis TaxID=2709663 RepID=UPI0013DB2D17|nr:hypothetical protein [Pyxidicoccus caerfyrddinensis]
MSSSIDLKKVVLRGPFWRAEAELVRAEDPKKSYAFRQLFLDLNGREVDNEQLLAPTTVVVLCHVRSVEVAPSDVKYRWEHDGGGNTPSLPATAEELHDKVTKGFLALLLVQARPTDWDEHSRRGLLDILMGGPGRSASAPGRAGTPPAASGQSDLELTCLAGEIPLDKLCAQNNARDRLFRALTLDVAPLEPRNATGPACLTSALSVHASGLSVFGRIALPWEPQGKDRFAAPFLLAPVLPEGSRTTTLQRYLLSLEEERLTAVERTALTASWGRLASALNPGNPQLEGPASQGPGWVTLEVVNPRTVPRMTWEIPAWQEQPTWHQLHFGREELALLLSDASPYDPRTPPTSLARTVPEDVTVGRHMDGTVEVTLRSGPEGGASAKYQATRAQPEWTEGFTVTGVRAAFSPVDTPRLVRGLQRLPTPEWTAGTATTPAKPVEPALLWAFMRLEDGWAQLPVPNLTEQMYLDAGLARFPSTDTLPEPRLQGAVSYGNDKPEDGALERGEQSWSLTLTDLGGLTGTWRLQRANANAPLALASVQLVLHEPEVRVSGLVWLGSEAPRTEDALPDLEDWAGGLRPVTLRSVSPEDAFPAVVTAGLGTLQLQRRPGRVAHPSAQLKTWSFDYGADAEVLRAMADRNLLPPSLFASHLPLVWKRHPALPWIQALPLTQSRTPANHPSASRQLAPFELPVVEMNGLTLPSGWRFGVTGTNGAAAWPRARGPQVPACEWKGRPDLPLVSLSLPGLVLKPGANASGLPLDAGTTLPVQLRLDLPYTDEPQALARLKPPTRRPDEVTPTADDSPPEPPRPLVRETLADHWSRLSELAVLASADAVDAFSSSGGAVRVQGLVEPHTWTVSPTLALGTYPGSLVVANAAGAPAASVELKGEAALEGFTGRFESADGGIRLAAGTPSADAYTLVAGSMAAHAKAGEGLRDQRGLWRKATRLVGTQLRTAVRLEGGAAVELVSTLEAVTLGLGKDPITGGALTWGLWFRDLPAAAGEFRRDSTRSAAAQDVNDPEAGSREHNVLNGYEWRLAPPTDVDAFTLFGLGFYPLTLERVRLDAAGVTRLELVGRVQLPLSGGGELVDLGNALRLTFERPPSGGGLALTAAALEASPGAPAECEWPLELANGELGDAPRLTVRSAALTPEKDGLRVDGVQLAFLLFGATWNVPLPALTFTGKASPLSVRMVPAELDAAEPLSPKEVAVELDPRGLEYRVSLLVDVRLGRALQEMPPGPRTRPVRWVPVVPGATAPGAVRPTATPVARSAFRAGVRFGVVGTSQDAAAVTFPGRGRAIWESGFLLDDLELERPPPEVALETGPGALQLTWSRYRAPMPSPGSSGLQLLPGMSLVGQDAPGFVALSFDVLLPATGVVDVPTLRLRTSFVEALLSCRWGTFLQAEPLPAQPTLAQVAGSSAGDLVFGYTGQSRDSTWTETLLLNGYLEVKDLLSYPASLQYDASKVTLTVPAAAGAVPLAHVRHTARILFNQHALPRDAFEVSAGDLLFRLSDGRSWQFLAVVEHQLVDVAPGEGFTTPRLSNDRRWTALQEVRIASPAGLKAFLQRFKDSDLHAVSPTDDVDPVGEVLAGYLGQEVRTMLAGGSAPELAALPAGTLLVEATALHWVKGEPVKATAATTLQFLPSGTQQALLSNPQDYGPTDPADPRWLLLVVPFLGRLQDRTRDGLEAPSGPASQLQVDPVLNLERRRKQPAALPPLALALSGWADRKAAAVTFTSLDTARARSWSRLDPLSLEESWFRVQHPLPEPRFDTLQSVLAARPETPARLSRATALQYAFDPVRNAYPPGQPKASGGVDPLPGQARLQWRPDALLALQAVLTQRGSSTPLPSGWLLTALQLVSGGWLRPSTATGTRRFPAATALAPRADAVRAPMSLAVSPYLGLGFRPAAPREDDIPELVVVELLCLDRTRRALLPAASHVKEGGEGLDAVRASAIAWAREMHRRLTPESPLAVLRFREVYRTVASGEDEAVLTTAYSFSLVPGLERTGGLSRRVLKLRSPPARLRFRDGHFGGQELPQEVRPLELAPPQVTGVQPIHRAHRPASGPQQQSPRDWPWGLSALRTTVHYTHEQEGATGTLGPRDGVPDKPFSLWWQALQHQVQFRSATSAAGPTAGLPPLFRARAIKGLLPVLPQLPLPLMSPRVLLNVDEPDRMKRWQPVLPGTVRFHLTGSRPGVMLAMRHQLLRQAGLDPTRDEAHRGQGMVSGSIPVQHRVPRPVPLRENDARHPGAALRTWASHFEPGHSVLATASPADEAFIASFGDGPVHRLRLVLEAPLHGAIPASWDGTLTLSADVNAGASLADWTLALEIPLDGKVFAYGPAEPAEGGRLGFKLAGTGGRSAEEVRADFSQRLAPGRVLAVHARVGRVTGAEGFIQTLTFPLRVVDPGVLPLPLEPVFLHFEDPEYNRHLASTTRRATQLVKTLDGTQKALHAVTLATDRGEYNPDSRMALRFDWDDGTTGLPALLSLLRVGPGGVTRPLSVREDGVDTPALTVAPERLREVSLLDLRDGTEPAVLGPGEALMLKLTLKALPEASSRVTENKDIFLTVGITAEPVTPVPEAAYALLRRQQPVEGDPQVECARFAWGPAPARVELVCPEDLRTEVVRRRAVFHWRDTVRTGTLRGYDIQKLTQSGATHIPGVTELPKPPPQNS